MKTKPTQASVKELQGMGIQPDILVCRSEHPLDDGIKDKIEPDAELRENVFELTDEDKERLKIESLPADLHEAVEELKKDEFIQSVLGSHISGKYIEAKEAEWNEYRTQISDWEIEEYLYKF